MKYSDTSPTGIIQLISGGESKWVEFKSKLPPDDIVSKHIVAFANTEGGIIIFGVGDKGTVLGIPENNVKDSVEQLSNLTASLLPSPTEIGTVIHKGRTLIYYVVPPAPDEYKPLMTSKGEIYTRHGEMIHRNDIAQQLVKSTPSPTEKQPNVTVFIAMSFRDEEEPALVDYYRAMQRATERTELPISLNRIDLIEGDYEISQQIMEEIDKANILLADFTLSPRNVYFELGYARGKSSFEIIQTARSGVTLEFDVRNWRTIFYRNATELEEKLIPALTRAYERVVAEKQANKGMDFTGKTPVD
jgi:predicted HTH transcriptional regulator